jgi:ethanolamine utilization protein EutM
MPREALGLIETRDMIGAIEVTRAATKAAELVIISAEQNGSGRVTVKIEGTWAAVLAAIESGARAAERVGQLVSMHLIGNPDEDLSAILPYQLFIDRYQPNDLLATHKRPVAPKAATPRVTKSTRTVTPKKVREPKAVTPKPMVTKPPVPKAVAPKPIAAPKPEVVSTPIQSTEPVDMPSMAELEAMPVVKLRQFARSLTNLPIQGRQISMANKTQLLEAIRAIHHE